MVSQIRKNNLNNKRHNDLKGFGKKYDKICDPHTKKFNEKKKKEGKGKNITNHEIVHSKGYPHRKQNRILEQEEEESEIEDYDFETVPQENNSEEEEYASGSESSYQLQVQEDANEEEEEDTNELSSNQHDYENEKKSIASQVKVANRKKGSSGGFQSMGKQKKKSEQYLLLCDYYLL